jgi:HD-GYP domain-containing protein (c-di-GMP phosphodiesterase class II)
MSSPELHLPSLVNSGAEGPTRLDRVEVTLIPWDSPYIGPVRDAVRAAGGELVRTSSGGGPGDLLGRLLVVDLSQGPQDVRLGSRVIAICPRYDLDCYEVVPPVEVRWRLRRAVRNLIDHERLSRRYEAERETIRVLNEIGYALSAQTSQSALMDTLLTRARRVLQADGGSIYLVDGDKIRFVCSQNDTIAFRASQLDLPMDETSLAGFVASRGESLNIADMYDLDPELPYRPNRAFDRETGYRTRSTLVVPMKDRAGEVMGVMALVNRKPDPGVPLASFDQVEPFSNFHADLAGSIASQAAVALENYRLYREIRNLFDGFVSAAVTAIEARDPTTGGHSHRVAALTLALARAVDATGDGPYRTTRFSERELTELHYAAMLHDFGKVGVREQVLLKAEKLYPWELGGIEARFRVAGLQVMLEALRESAPNAVTEARLQELDGDLALVRRLNRPSTQPTREEVKRLELIPTVWKLPTLSSPLLETREVSRLCIPFGSLDPEERREIEQHVTHTYEFLRVIPWTRDLSRVPELAYCHHEKLDGTGYPRRLQAEEIPLGARLMSIADIFDALTAGDRPYKPGMPVQRAVEILNLEAQRGKLESAAVELFERRQLWRGIIGEHA